MKNTLRNIIATAGMVGLASIGCSDCKERFNGAFRDYKVNVTMNLIPKSISPRISVKMIDGLDGFPSPIHIIVAEDSIGDGHFEDIYFDGMNMKDLEPLRRNLRNNPLYNYANQDSVYAAYKAVMEQNVINPNMLKHGEKK